MSGWICSYRSIWEHPLFAGDAERVGVWDWMIKKAAWKPTRFKVGGKVITLDRGQLCVSYRQVSRETGMSLQRFRTFMSELAANKAITQDTTHGRSVITICNYGNYQNVAGGDNKAGNTAATQQQHTKEQVNTSANADADESAPVDVKKIAFSEGRRLLAESGKSSDQAGRLIGKWIRDHGEAMTIEALGKAQRAGAIDPASYVEGVLKRARNTGPPGASSFHFERFDRKSA